MNLPLLLSFFPPIPENDDILPDNSLKIFSHRTLWTNRVICKQREKLFSCLIGFSNIVSTKWHWQIFWNFTFVTNCLLLQITIMFFFGTKDNKTKRHTVVQEVSIMTRCLNRPVSQTLGKKCRSTKSCHFLSIFHHLGSVTYYCIYAWCALFDRNKLIGKMITLKYVQGPSSVSNGNIDNDLRKLHLQVSW